MLGPKVVMVFFTLHLLITMESLIRRFAFVFFRNRRLLLFLVVLNFAFFSHSIGFLNVSQFGGLKLFVLNLNIPPVAMYIVRDNLFGRIMSYKIGIVLLNIM